MHDFMSAKGLGCRQRQVLAYVRKWPGSSGRSIAHSLNLDWGYVNSILNRLEERGLVDENGYPVETRN